MHWLKVFSSTVITSINFGECRYLIWMIETLSLIHLPLSTHTFNHTLQKYSIRATFWEIYWVWIVWSGKIEYTKHINKQKVIWLWLTPAFFMACCVFYGEGYTENITWKTHLVPVFNIEVSNVSSALAVNSWYGNWHNLQKGVNVPSLRL